MANLVEAFTQLTLLGNDSSIVELFLKLLEESNTTLVKKNGVFYIYNKETRLYEPYSVNPEDKYNIINYVEKTCQAYINTLLNEAKQALVKNGIFSEEQSIISIAQKIASKKEHNNCTKLENTFHKIYRTQKYFGSSDKMTKVMKKMITTDKIKETDIEMDTNAGVLHFNNGKLDLQSGEFKKRTKNDFSTFCLPYDYNTDVNEKVLKYCKKILFQIFNNDEKMNDCLLSQLAYQLTGENNLQTILYWLGSSASNGKTTLFKILSNCFGEYIHKLDTSFLNKGNQDRFRELNLMKDCTRIAYIEEQDAEMDKAFLKQFVSGNDEVMNVKQLYKSASKKKVIHQCLNICSNIIPLFNMCNGVKRRLREADLISEFIDPEDYPENPKPTQFIKDKKLLFNFKKDEYKNAIIQILLPYWIEFYKTGTVMHEELLKASANESAEINDTFKTFLEDNFTITKSENDKISRQDFLDVYKRSSMKNLEFKFILSDLKTAGLTYNKDKQCNGKRGVIYGLKRKCIDDDETKIPVIDALEDNPEPVKKLEPKSVLQIINDVQKEKEMSLEDIDAQIAKLKELKKKKQEQEKPKSEPEPEKPKDTIELGHVPTQGAPKPSHKMVSGEEPKPDKQVQTVTCTDANGITTIKTSISPQDFEKLLDRRCKNSKSGKDRADHSDELLKKYCIHYGIPQTQKAEPKEEEPKPEPIDLSQKFPFQFEDEKDNKHNSDLIFGNK